jgi:IS1 family transposase
MNKLRTEKQKLVLSLLTEGNSIRSIERITGVNQNTVMSLLVKTGSAAQSALDAEIKNVPCHYLELDEIWTYIGCKQYHLRPEERSNRGDQYVFVAIDAESKLIPHFTVGKRDEATTVLFLEGLRDRVQSGEIQFSTDGFQCYPYAIWSTFRNAVHGQVIKSFGIESKGERRYSPPKVISIERISRLGNPVFEHISTSFVERQNLTMRMQMRRFTRLTNGFSKKLENLVAACSLHFYHYNFMRVHESLKMTPAMAAGIAKAPWSWDAIL